MAEVGTAYLSVVPSARGFGSTLSRQVAPQMAASGTMAGKQYGDRMRTSMGSRARSIFAPLATAGGAILAGRVIADSVKLEAAFSTTMRRIAATTDAPRKAVESLEGLAMKLGAQTVFSANEAADAMFELAKGGLTPATIQAGALKNALTLATAGSLDLETAGTTVVQTLGAFQLSGRQSAAAVAALAGAANASAANVGDIGIALSQAGTEANSVGLTVQETTAILAAFSNAGIKGSDAGTSLRTMLARLVPTTAVAKKEMESLGLSFVDANGEFVNAETMAARLRDAFGEMSAEERSASLTTIFGADARRAVNVLVGEGAEGVRGLIKETSDLTAAEKLANAAMGGTSGALERMDGAIETAKLQIGKGLAPVVQDLADWIAKVVVSGDLEKWAAAAGEGLQDFGGFIQSDVLPPAKALGGFAVDAVKWFKDLPGPIKTTAVALAALYATGAIGGISRLSAGIAGFGTTLGRTSDVMRNSAARAAALGPALRNVSGAGGIGLLALSASQAEGPMKNLTAVAGAAATGFAVGGPLGAGIGAFAGVLYAMRQEAGAAAKALGAVDAALKTPANLPGIDKALATAREQLAAATHTADVVGDLSGAAVSIAGRYGGAGVIAQATEFTDRLSDQDRAALGAQRSLVALARATGQKIDPSNHEALLGVMEKLGPAFRKVGIDANAFLITQMKLRSTSDLGTGFMGQLANLHLEGSIAQIKEMRAEHRKLTSTILAASDANIGYEQALDDAMAEARSGAKTLNINTQAGRDNRTSLNILAGAWDNLSPKVQKAEGAVGSARKEFIKVATVMGMDADKAKALARELIQIPDVKPKVEVEGVEAATTKIKNFTGMIGTALGNIKDEPVSVTLQAQAKTILNMLGSFGNNPNAAGGPVSGGRPGRDSVPALLMPGEHIWTTDEVKRAGGHGVMQAFRRMALRGELPKRGDPALFAGGGAVEPQPSLTGLSSSVGAVERVFGAIAAAVGRQISKNVSKFLTHMPTGGGPLGSGGTLAPAQIARGQNFARGQAGKPYIWGGVGPGGYDCSGFQSAVLNAAHGRNPYQRIGSTGTAPWAGSRPGRGNYTIGWFSGSPGHMSGNIGGLGVESAGGAGVRLGGSALSPLDNMFNGLMHYDKGGLLYPGLTAALNTTGRIERVSTGDDDLTKATKKLADRMDAAGKRIDNLRGSVDKNNEETKALRQAQQEFAAGVIGTIKTDPFAENATLQGALLSLQQDRQDAQKLTKLGRRAANQFGLSGPAFRQLMQSENGMAILAQIDSRADANALEQAFKRRGKATEQLGQFAGNQFNGRQLAQNNRKLDHLARSLDRLAREFDRQKLHKAVRDGARDGTREGAEQGTKRGNRRRDRDARMAAQFASTP